MDKVLNILILLGFFIISIFTLVFLSTSKDLFSIFLIMFSIILSLQGLFTIIWMLYSWEDPQYADLHKSPKVYRSPKFSFTALLPARNEQKVIRQTIESINHISYPNELKEILVLCRDDDISTITEAQLVISELNNPNIKIVTFTGHPINKPYALNRGLTYAQNNIIAVFDAEDEPHPDIYNVVNTIIQNENVAIVQSGVQLMNYRSNWFSPFNVLEYFFWFKSGLHFFTKVGKVTPLGGNTVFFRKEWLQYIKGWDENCLTEDADIGFRLSLAGAKIRVVYDEQHVTQEETPPNVASFIKQRTRWNQGFLQIFSKGDWMKFPSLKQKLLALYILLSPEAQVLILILTPIAIWGSISNKIPVLMALFSFIPLYLLFIQILIFAVGMSEFTGSYKLKYPLLFPLKIFLLFFPYQFLLLLSSSRAILRMLLNQNGWEKTLHLNAHRNLIQPALNPNYAQYN